MDGNIIQSNQTKIFVVVVLLLAILGKADGLNLTTCNNRNMTNLTIDFQDGFVNDSIECRLNGKIVYSKNDCNTSQLIGLADSVSVNLEKGLNKLKVIVVSRGIEKEILLEVKNDLYVGISIVNNTIEHVLSAKPFGYG